MGLRLGDMAPDFTAQTTEGEIRFHDWLGSSWGVLFSHPKDFTPVCTTELGYMSDIQSEFDKRNVKILALSVDTVEDHLRWIEDINDLSNTRITYPVIADQDRVVSTLYDMIHPNSDNTFAVRSVFVIGPDKDIKVTIAYPVSTGRNFDELLRVIDSLQLTVAKKLATPVNWKRGEPCVVMPEVSDEEAIQRFSTINKVRPYLRFTPDPSSRVLV